MMEEHLRNQVTLSSDGVFKFLVGLYVLLLPISTGLSGIIGNISLLNYIAVGIIIVGILKARSIPVSIVPTALYFIYTIISIIWSGNIVFNWYVATNVVNFVLFIVINTYRWKEEDINQVYKCIFLSQLIVFFAVLVNVPNMSNYRLTITIVSTIGISDFACGLCLIIALWMTIASTTKNTWIRVLSYVSIGFDFAVILMAGSRGAIAMFIAMIVVWILMGNSSRRIKIVTIIVIIVAIFFFQNYFMDFLPSYIRNRLTLDAVMQSHGSGRYNIWRQAWDTFIGSNIGRMLFGYGFNSFLDAVSYGQHGGNQDLLAHNVIIQTMIEGGVFGLLFLFWMLISQFKSAWRRNDSLMKIALVGLIVAALSIDMQVTRIWGFILTFNFMRTLRGETNGSRE